MSSKAKSISRDSPFKEAPDPLNIRKINKKVSKKCGHDLPVKVREYRQLIHNVVLQSEHKSIIK
jgi:hypothetical protein